MANYSLAQLASEIEFDVEDYSSLLKLFVNTTNSNLVEIISAVIAEDCDLISTNIHNIKGASMNLGLNKITEIVDQMSKFNNDSSFADIEAKVKECEAELTELKRLLE